MATELITGPANECISYEQALIQLRINTFDESINESLVEELERLITVVREDAEEFTNRKFITQTWRYYLDAWPRKNYIELPFSPLQSVSSITILTKDEVSESFSSTYYLQDTKSIPGRIILVADQSWPCVELYTMNPIQIEFICGYGNNPEDVPRKIIQAMLIQLTDLYENRQGIVRGQPIQRLNTYERLLSSAIDYRFGAEK